MKKLILAVLMVFPFLACESSESKVIEFSGLPAAAQKFVKTHFADKTVSVVYSDKDLFDHDYEVVFEDGSSVEFNEDGQWKDIEVKTAPGVPEKAMPVAIVNYVKAKHPSNFVKQISKDKREYEVELNNGVDIVFDKNGNFKRYDD